MTEQDKILQRIQTVARSTFGDRELALTHATTADDVPGWDSLTHVSFIAAVEQEFGMRFSIPEVAALDSIGDLVNLVSSQQRGDR